MKIIAILITAQILICLQMEAQMNPTTGPFTAQAASFYSIVKPGDITMQVNIWGYVQKPGRYEIPISTDLIELLSYAGGPMQYADMDKIKIIRLPDTLGGKRGEIYVDLSKADKIEPEKLILQNGDTIFMDHTSWVNIRDVFSVVTTAALVTAAISQLVIASRR